MKDKDILERIKELSNEDWFKNGEDAPEEVCNEFEDIEASDPNLDYLLGLTIGGPGSTDVWLSRGVLIGDVFAWGDGLDEDEEITEDDIYEDNRMYIADRRATLVDEIIL